jgi:hypothetical protein
VVMMRFGGVPVSAFKLEQISHSQRPIVSYDHRINEGKVQQSKLSIAR